MTDAVLVATGHRGEVRSSLPAGDDMTLSRPPTPAEFGSEAEIVGAADLARDVALSQEAS